MFQRFGRRTGDATRVDVSVDSKPTETSSAEVAGAASQRSGAGLEVNLAPVDDPNSHDSGAPQEKGKQATPAAAESRRALRTDLPGRAHDLTASLTEILARSGADGLKKAEPILIQLRETNELLWFDPDGDFRSTREDPAPLSKIAAALAKRPTPVSVGCGLLARMNRIKDPNKVPGHRKLRVPIDSVTIGVHRDSFSLVLYLGEYAIDAFPIGVGKASTPTPTGDFELREIQHLDKMPRKDTVWTRPEDGRTFFFGDPEFPFGKRFLRFASPYEHYGIHGTDSDAAIGNGMSHGCVRMKNTDVEVLAGLVDPSGPCRVKVRID